MKGRKMNPEDLKIRLISQDDLDEIVKIDRLASGQRRDEYYTNKMRRALDRAGIVTSLVAEYEGKVAGFLMGEVNTGEFGIPEKVALVDTIGVHPDYTGQGVGSALFSEFLTIMRGLKVRNIQTLVPWDSPDLVPFFSRQGFAPSGMLHLSLKIED